MAQNNKTNNSNNTAGGIGFFGMLTLAFIVLKLIGIIDWDWIWVLGPFWIPLALLFVGLLIYLLLKS